MRGIFGNTRWLWRLPVLLVIALALPFATPHLPLAGPLERTVHDAYRYLLAERTGPDPDIALPLYNDKVARETQRTSPVDRALLADALRGIAAAGPSPPRPSSSTTSRYRQSATIGSPSSAAWKNGRSPSSA